MPRSRVSTSSRQKTRNCSGLPGACSRAARRSRVAIRAEPLMSATAGSSWRVARRPSTTSPRERSATAVSPRLGQHPLDVAHEDAAGADHQHAAALVAAPVGVEEVRHAVQRDHGLAGARAAADRDDPAAGRADRQVLLGLDGRDDGVHRAVAGPRQLRHQRALADDRELDAVGLELGQRLGVEQLVLDADDLGTGRAQHPAAYDLAGLGRGRLVEHGGRGRAPVDEQRVAVPVAQPDPADVARLPVHAVLHVEAAEDQALVGGVELRDPARGLEDHRVPLDQAALVAQLAAVLALPGQLLCVAGGLLQLEVDPVDESLLGLDLPINQVSFDQCVVQRVVPSAHPGVDQVAAAAKRQAPKPNSREGASGDRPIQINGRLVVSPSGTGRRSSPPWPRPRRTAGR